jgi:uncharacterized protein
MPPTSTPTAPSTPCRRLCRLDPASGLCLGCGRTGAEIAAWAGLGEPARRALMGRLPARLRGLRGPPRDATGD